ncbi:hypothetical protein BaRGS_00006203 [Batillaria attramentaria]|uniref:EGF-like domain-containing protein n=1 Tax=Batillaria attramentaria TaxID=370345 RepID=A0ABD0LT01_9CAEN
MMGMTCMQMFGGVRAVCYLSVVVMVFGLQVRAASCPPACVSGVCDDETGNCVVDWGSGEAGAPGIPQETPQEPVTIGCPKGLYGSDCSQECPLTCKNSVCERDTGDCTQGCVAGYNGTNCSTECPDGFHGPNCQVSCSSNCKNGTCNPKSGICLHGCEDGFWGSDCSLGVDLSRSSAREDQRKLYAHLSAEGKSILLFMLTPQYERALARAQFEIETAVKFRNTIQNLLN